MGASLRMLLRFKMAYRQVRSGIGGVLLSVVAIGLGVGLVVGVRQMNGVVLKSFMETMDAMGGRAALRVIAGEGASFGEDIAEKVGGVAGVKLAVPLVSGIAFPDDDSGELLTVHGVDVTEDAAVRVYEAVGKGEESELVEDPLEFIAQADSILLGEEFARRRGIEVGDGMDLVTPVGVKQFKVRGLLKAAGVGRVLGGRLARARAGRDMGKDALGSWEICFNPRARAGRDFFMLCRCLYHGCFNPRARAGRDRRPDRVAVP